MKKILIYTAIIGALLAVISGLYTQMKSLEKERDDLKERSETLLGGIINYKTADSLNVASIGRLKLSLSEYKKYRSDDLKTINSLDVKNRKLTSVTTTELKTINQINGIFRDSIVYLNSINEKLLFDNKNISIKADTIKCININEKWFDLKGCIRDNNKFSGVYVGRDSLLIAATTKYKRFLGFLWYTNKIKDRKIDIVSKNKSTQIIGFEFVEIEK